MVTPFIADLHIHSKYSRACSRDCDLEHLTWWARRKGITLVGTGDFTHPAWFAHLNEALVPAEPGLYRLRDELAQPIDAKTSSSCQTPVRFLLSVEISTIYKRDGHTRKVHHLVFMPNLAAVERFNKALGAIGNLGSDGRPILGLDSRDLVEIALTASPNGYVVPAHIWTPWFAALGSKSGFDAISDCYADLADQIFAVETGLSSDPAMNWQVSSLDRYTLISNSDAHSPPMLGREATRFSCRLDYFAIAEALRRNDGSVGTIEFFPEEGKYHLDGHRTCGVRWEPAESKAADLRCSGCGKPVTVGVSHRVDDLADRPIGTHRPGAGEFRCLVPLPEIIGEIVGRGPKTKTVQQQIDALVHRHGPELTILQDTPVDDLARSGGELVGEAIRRLRVGEVHRDAGYDGEYGRISLFEPDEIAGLRAGGALFTLARPTPTVAPASDRPSAASGPPVAAQVHPPAETAHLPTGLDPEQSAAVTAPVGPLLIVAGPGTGKTRTLTHRIAHLVRAEGVAADAILAITFTRRAATELTDRLRALLDSHPTATTPTIGTFHAVCLGMLTENPHRIGLDADFRLADAAELRAVLTEVTGKKPRGRHPAIPTEHREAVRKTLRAGNRLAVDELVDTAVELLAEAPNLAAHYRERWPHIFVDEYQDVDAAQYRLLRLLAPATSNLCVVGDPDQAIYSFRGADVQYFHQFTADYPQATTVRLRRNYRSSAAIVTAATQVLGAPADHLQATRQPTEPISWISAAEERSEAEQIVAAIDGILGGTSFHSLDTGRVDARSVPAGPRALGDVAVLVRSGSQLPELLRAFNKAGIPVQHHSHDPLRQLPGLATLMRELALASGLEDSTTADVSALVVAAGQRLERERADGTTVTDVWTAVETIRPLAETCTDVAELQQLVAVGVEVDGHARRPEAVNLLTMHAAKGLEFDVVFIAGCGAAAMPLRRPDVDLAEERRLLFVGVTRARDQLVLAGVGERSTLLAGLSPEPRSMTRRRPPRKSTGQQLRLL